MPTTSRRLCAILFSSVLQTVIFPVAGPLPYGRAVLAWCALVPWLVLLLTYPLRRSRGYFRAAGWSYLCGVLWYAGHCNWVFDTMYQYGGMGKPLAALILLLFCLYLGLYHLLFGAAVLVLRQSRRWGTGGVAAAVPFVWCAVELARARLTSFPWDLLGYSQIDNAVLTPMARFGGTYSLGWCIAAVNAALALAWVRRGNGGLRKSREFRKPQEPGRPEGFHRPWAALRKHWELCLGTGALAVAVLLSLLGAFTRPRSFPAPETALLVQPNLPPGSEAAVPEAPLLQELAALSLRPGGLAVRGMRAPVVLWPESPSPFVVGEPLFTTTMTTLARQTQATVIAGATAVQPDSQNRRRNRIYNSAALFTAETGYAGRYDKIHLVPFGEFVPYEDVFSFAGGLTQQVGHTDRGRVRAPLSAGGHRYGTFICYESIFADEVRRLAMGGADVLVNLSDDGWYGDTSAPFQHINMARMRAIENQRWLLRDTNTGVTAAIDPAGTVHEQAPRHERTSALVHFDYVSGTTFYSRHGDVFAYLCAAAALALLLRAWQTGPGEMNGRLEDEQMTGEVSR